MIKRVWMILLLAPIFFVALGLTGCSLTYVAHVMTGQMRIAEKKENIQTIIKAATLPSAEIEKLKLVQDVRKFSFETLKLTQNDNYTEYVKLDRDYVAMNIVVCPKDTLKPHTWWFPFIGNIGYLGFFNIDYAREVQKEFDEDNYDTYLRGVSAYSTLGWFDDPVFSTMLKYSDESLANTIIHELAHGTIYKNGDTPFNEGVATFIGNVGSIQFLIQHYGRESKLHRLALDNQHDALLFSRFIRSSQERLSKYYSSPLSSKEKIAGRHVKFKEIKDNFRNLKPQFKTRQYHYFEQLQLNNAVMAGFGQYYEELELFEKVWKKNKKDFIKTLELFKKAQRVENAMAFLRAH